MRDPIETIFKLSGFQLLLLLCWIEVKTGFMVGDYFYCSLVIVYVSLLVAWKKTIQPRKV